MGGSEGRVYLGEVTRHTPALKTQLESTCAVHTLSGLDATMGAMSGARELLEAEREEALRRLDYLTGDFNDVVEAARDANNDDEHDPEGATIAFERAQVSALAQQVRDHLAEIEAALDRVTAGTYGTCAECGQPIGERRLEARPSARTCIACAAATG